MDDRSKAGRPRPRQEAWTPPWQQERAQAFVTLKMKSYRRRDRSRRNVMRSAERREEIVQSPLVRQIDKGKTGAPFVLVALEDVVVSNANVEEISLCNARRI